MATNPYDPKEKCCGWCYGTGALRKCSKCPRPYCSRECQVRDWKNGGHKIWCGKAGEKGFHYEIRETGENGLGLFAKENIRRGEKILVERPVIVRQPDGSMVSDALTNSNIETATMALSPQNASLNFKFLINCVALGGVEEHDAGSGLFVNFSRVNHDCVGNSSHYFDPELGLKLLVANHDIPAGSEVTFSYVSDADSSSGRAERLNFRGFKCTCAACQTPEIAAKLDRMIELDRKIMILGSHGKSEAAIRAGTALIKLYDELQCSDMLYARTYYDLFQVAIPKSRTVQQGRAFIKKAYEHGLLFYGREAHEAVRQYKKYAEQPSLHRNYRCID